MTKRKKAAIPDAPVIRTIAIYARVSTKDRGQDTANQLAPLREFAARNGWAITREYVDHISAKSGNREQFQQMFMDAEAKQFDLLLFWSLDRLSREGAFETLQYLNRLTACGVGWRSFTEQYLDSTGMFREAVISILAVVAKQERVRISERVCAGLDRARASGKRLGRIPQKEMTERDVTRIATLRGSGKSFRQIAELTGFPLATCFRAFQNPVECELVS
jgi:DNA invertase Pin-like site-specific DNA recombinase